MKRRVEIEGNAFERIRSSRNVRLKGKDPTWPPLRISVSISHWLAGTEAKEPAERPAETFAFHRSGVLEIVSSPSATTTSYVNREFIARQKGGGPVTNAAPVLCHTFKTGRHNKFNQAHHFKVRPFHVRTPRRRSKRLGAVKRKLLRTVPSIRSIIRASSAFSSVAFAHERLIDIYLPCKHKIQPRPNF